MTLDQLIADLTAYAASGPNTLADHVLALARVVAEMRKAVEDNARIADYEALKRTASEHATVRVGIERDIAIRERDAALADVQRLTAEHSQALADRDCAFRAEVARLTAERDEIESALEASTTTIASSLDSLAESYKRDRDRLAAEVKTLTWQRDAARSTADELARVAETTERETVERIAAWLLTNVYDDVARNQIVEIMRRGDWRTK